MLDIEASQPAVVPDHLTPPLATPQPMTPPGDWLYEIKYQGHRVLTRVAAGEVRLFYRDGEDWTHHLPAQVAAVGTLELDNSWLDGELVALGEDGTPDFPALQQAMASGTTEGLVYYLFDLPFLHCTDLREQPLETRREKLRQILAGHRHPCLRFSDAFASREAEVILECAEVLHIDGLIAKRAGSPYQADRSPDWIKLDCAPTPASDSP
jgi:bifunctional non-homologous end joining protein LigD